MYWFTFYYICAAITFASGAILVCISIYLYGLPKLDTSKLSRQDTDKELKQKLINVWVADLQQRNLFGQGVLWGFPGT